MQCLAPAKINLHLRVAPPDVSGFHPLMSWMCTVGLFDTLTIGSGDARGEAVSFECDDPRIPCDATNLVVRAAIAMQEEIAADSPASGPGHAGGRAGGARSAVRIRLGKKIPSGGGMGGGSSDAARTLMALNRFWNLNWPIERLSRLAAKLGSDVSFFLRGPSSACTGRGEIVRPIARPKPRWVVLILPALAVSTPAVYRKFDELRLGDRAAVETQPDWKQWAELSAGPLLHQLVNDLEAPAFALCPQLARLRMQIEESIGRIVRMSGSGSSLFTLFDQEAEALRVVERIRDRHGTTALAAPTAPEVHDDLLAAPLGA